MQIKKIPADERSDLGTACGKSRCAPGNNYAPGKSAVQSVIEAGGRYFQGCGSAD